MFKLIGILVIILGFIFKLDTIAVIIVAGFVTGLASGMNLIEILSLLGQAFVDTRYMSIFLITLPVMGMLERYGLRNAAANVILNLKNATVTKIFSIFLIMRLGLAALGVRLSGHIQFIRPMLYPMVESAQAQQNPSLSLKQKDKLKTMACALENYGNFFGQNIFVANAGVLLIVGTLQELGYILKNSDISLAAIYPALFLCILALIQIIFAVRKLGE